MSFFRSFAWTRGKVSPTGPEEVTSARRRNRECAEDVCVCVCVCVCVVCCQQVLRPLVPLQTNPLPPSPAPDAVLVRKKTDRAGGCNRYSCRSLTQHGLGGWDDKVCSFIPSKCARVSAVALNIQANKFRPSSSREIVSLECRAQYHHTPTPPYGIIKHTKKKRSVLPSWLSSPRWRHTYHTKKYVFGFWRVEIERGEGGGRNRLQTLSLSPLPPSSAARLSHDFVFLGGSGGTFVVKRPHLLNEIGPRGDAPKQPRRIPCGPPPPRARRPRQAFIQPRPALRDASLQDGDDHGEAAGRPSFGDEGGGRGRWHSAPVSSASAIMLSLPSRTTSASVARSKT
jgi:hypothetical protein